MIAVLAVLAWLILLAVYQATGIVDERLHLLAARGFYVGEAGWLPFLAMLQ